MTRMKEYRNSAGLFTALVLPCHSLLDYIITLNLNAHLKPWAKNSFSFYVLHDFFSLFCGNLNVSSALICGCKSSTPGAICSNLDFICHGSIFKLLPYQDSAL